MKGFKDRCLWTVILLVGMIGVFILYPVTQQQHEQSTQVTQTQRPEVKMEPFELYTDFVIANKPMLGLSSTHINIITVIRKRDGKVFYALGGDHPDQFKEPYLRGRAVRLLKITGIELPIIAY